VAGLMNDVDGVGWVGWVGWGETITTFFLLLQTYVYICIAGVGVWGYERDWDWVWDHRSLSSIYPIATALLDARCKIGLDWIG